MLIFFICWYFIGILSFIYWWRKDYPHIFVNEELVGKGYGWCNIMIIVLIFLVGSIGPPIAFLAGWDIHGKGKTKINYNDLTQKKN